MGAIAGATIGGVAFLSSAAVISFCCFQRRRKARSDLAGPHRPPITFIGNRSSRISRVRSSFLPASSRMRRAHSSFDLLPPSALHQPSRRNSSLHQSSLPLPDDQYLPSPYILPSEAEAADGHSVTQLRSPPATMRRSRINGVVSYAQSHSRSLSRSDTEAPLSPISALSNPHSDSHVRRPSASTKASLSGTGVSAPRFIVHRDADDVVSDEGDSSVVELPPQYTDRRGSSPKRDDSKESI